MTDNRRAKTQNPAAETTTTVVTKETHGGGSVTDNRPIEEQIRAVLDPFTADAIAATNAVLAVVNPWAEDLCRVAAQTVADIARDRVL